MPRGACGATASGARACRACRQGHRRWRQKRWGRPRRPTRQTHCRRRGGGPNEQGLGQEDEQWHQAARWGGRRRAAG
eukprot:13917289-Alexandrium_andersonii.AAC.1